MSTNTAPTGVTSADGYEALKAAANAPVSKTKDYFAGIFLEEEQILSVTYAARAAGLPIHDCFTPYAVHNLDKAQGIKRSLLTYAALLWGTLGFSLAFFLQVHTQSIDFINTDNLPLIGDMLKGVDVVPFLKGWPIIVGGKPFLPWPAFVPVFFELTVLCTGHLTVLTLLVYRGLYPGKKPKIHIDGVTDDRFAIVLDPAGKGYDEAQARALFEQHGAAEVITVEGRI